MNISVTCIYIPLRSYLFHTKYSFSKFQSYVVFLRCYNKRTYVSENSTTPRNSNILISPFTKSWKVLRFCILFQKFCNFVIFILAVIFTKKQKFKIDWSLLINKFINQKGSHGIEPTLKKIGFVVARGGFYSYYNAYKKHLT